MTTEEAAELLKCTADYVGKLCRDGVLPGAFKVGKKMWMVPEQSVRGYKPGPQGFAAVKARKKAAEAKLLAELNEAIRGRHDGVGQQLDEAYSLDC